MRSLVVLMMAIILSATIPLLSGCHPHGRGSRLPKKVERPAKPAQQPSAQPTTPKKTVKPVKKIYPKKID